MEKEGRIRIDEKNSYTDLNGDKIIGVPEYLQTEDTPVDSNWTELRGYVRSKRYPGKRLASSIIMMAVIAENIRLTVNTC